MNIKYKIISIGVVIVAVVAAIAVSHQQPVSTGKPTVVIGVTLPLTGDIAALGQSNKNAIEMAYENLATSTLKYNYKLVFEDDQFNPSIGATTANKLISIDGANALISFGSPVGNVVSPIAEANKIPHINDFASDPHVASGTYNFVDYTPAYEDAKLMIQELEKRGITKIVFFEQGDNSGAAAIISAFENDIQNSNIKVLSTQAVLTGSTDFRTQIDKVKDLGADIYVLEVTTPELEILTNQMRAEGIKTPLTNMESFEFSNQLSLFEGMWYVNDADPTQWFVDMYTQKYGEAPKFGAANGYDSFNMIVQAVETAGDGKTIPTGTQIADVIASIKGFNGALGDNLNVGPDHIVDSKSVVRMIKNGVPETIAP